MNNTKINILFNRLYNILNQYDFFNLQDNNIDFDSFKLEFINNLLSGSIGHITSYLIDLYDNVEDNKIIDLVSDLYNF